MAVASPHETPATWEVGQAAHEAARTHLEACFEAMYAAEDGEDVPSPASAPFDGCEDCVIRETLFAAFPIISTDPAAM